MHRPSISAALLITALLLAGCSSGSEPKASGADVETSTSDEQSASGETSTFTAEVWADNWFSLYVDGELVGEDSVPITTERSFNAETITFTATYPFTVAMVTKDFKETDSGLEYIGTDRQQMGDAGFIAQITDTGTGEVVAATSSEWVGLVIHKAPLNKECESSSDPASDCEFDSADEPAGWAEADHDDGDWTTATIFSAVDVDPKEGYDSVSWDAAAQLIWTSDLEADNTVLWRFEVDA